VLDHIYEQPIVSVIEVRGLTGTTYPAANDLASPLVDLGILAEMTGHDRNRRFRYDKQVGTWTSFTSRPSTPERRCFWSEKPKKTPRMRQANPLDVESF
jgi:hypothetical protein